MKRPLRLAILAAAAISIAFAACSLNPQPIPPGIDNADAATFGGADGGRGGTGADGDAEPPTPNSTSDAATKIDGGPELFNDGGDAGDADAGPEAADAADGG